MVSKEAWASWCQLPGSARPSQLLLVPRSVSLCYTIPLLLTAARGLAVRRVHVHWQDCFFFFFVHTVYLGTSSLQLPLLCFLLLLPTHPWPSPLEKGTPSHRGPFLSLPRAGYIQV